MRACAAAIALGRRLLPQRCTLCAASAGGALLCRACEESLPRLPPSCPVCALPSPTAAVCASCVTRPPPYIATVAALAYAHPADHLLRQLKYRGRLALAHWAAAALASAVRARLEARVPGEYPDRVVALPLARARQRERGFNQAREIAKRVARTLALPLAPVLERVVAGPPQAALPWRERRHNVRGAFAARGDVRGARLALVDDVMTTGATLAEAALALKHAGAAQVECWVVARTLPPGAT
jgi:ComF family protein